MDLRWPVIVAFGSLVSVAVVAAACSSSDDSSKQSSSGGSSGSNGTSGVNPPPPAPGCPGDKPQADTPCTENGLLCDYGTPAFGCPDPNTQGRSKCQTGQWNAPAEDPECNYPGTGCPPTVKAAIGSACPANAGVCIYVDCMGVYTPYSCVDGKLTGPTPPTCSDSGSGDSGGGG